MSDEWVRLEDPLSAVSWFRLISGHHEVQTSWAREARMVCRSKSVALARAGSWDGLEVPSDGAFFATNTETCYVSG